jgi:hypothetical protein
MTQHASLSPARWRAFPLDQQVLMIGNEMNRLRRLMDPARGDSRRLAYERVLRLTDLTVETASSTGLRRELLRWRDLVAALYIAVSPESAAHDAAFRALLGLTPESAKQIRILL